MSRASTKARASPRCEPLEQRILHSADAAPVVLAVQAGSAFVQQLVAPAAPLQPADMAPAIAATTMAAADTTRPASTTSHELVVIDLRVPDAAGLVADLAAQQAAGRAIDLLLIDGDQDGIQLVSDALAGASRPYDAVHLIAHGEPGSQQLGATMLDMATIRARADQFAQWAPAFTASGDLLLYGCDVAADPAGQLMVDALANLTGTDVAASTDATGSALRGGNWALEYRAGTIEAGIAISLTGQSAWDGLLAPVIANPGVDTLVNPGTGGTQQTTAGFAGHQVATNASGQTVVAWEDVTTGQVNARLFNAAGSAQTGQITVSTSAASPQDQPSVAIDEAGNFVVVWTAGASQDGDGTGIYGRTFNAAGIASSGEFLVNQTTTGNQSLATVAINPQAASALIDFTVTWTCDYGAGSSNGVLARGFQWSGAAAGSELPVNTTVVGDQQDSAIAYAGDGTALIVWQSAGQDGSGWGIYGQRLDATGAMAGGEFRINTLTALDQTNPDVGADAAGNFVAVWTCDMGNGDKTDIRARRIDATGTLVGSEISVAQTTNKEQSDPSVSVRAAGDFLVAWQSFDQDIGGTWGIYTRQFEADATPVGNEMLVNATTAADQVAPTVTFAGSQAVVVWSGRSDASTPTDSQGVFLQRLSVAQPQFQMSQTGSTTSEAVGGPTVALSFVLTAAPTANVMLTLAVTDATEGQLSASTLTFTSANWNIAQSVTVSGVDDLLVDGPKAYQVQVTTASTDANYAGKTFSSGTITNLDNDGINTLLVDTNADTNDGDTSSIAALLANKGGDGRISLREAILAANATANGPNGPDRIVFDLSAYGNGQIGLTSGLTVTDAVVIDGTTAPGYGASPVVQLTHGSLGIFDGLTLAAGSAGSTVRGLVFSNFWGSGIVVNSASDLLELNRVGTNAAGTSASSNLSDGIALLAGATNAVVRDNLVSGNALGAGIYVNGAAGALITGNLIGTNASATASLGNNYEGIYLSGGAHDITIQGNTIGGNGLDGITLDGVSNSVISGNWIGTNAAGNVNLHNQGNGVQIRNGASDNLVGGPTSGAGNLIAFNLGRAIAVANFSGYSQSNSLLGNRIDANGFGIDLDPSGSSLTLTPVATANDAGDADSGPNNLQNTPVLDEAIRSAGNLAISGQMNSTANSHFRIEFFADPTPDASGHGQAAVFIGYLNVDTDGSGNAVFNASFASSLLAGTAITATATLTDQSYTTFFDTSEFAANIMVDTPPTVTSAAAFTVNENGTPVATLAATDPDLPAQTLTWSIDGGTDAARFALNATTGALTFVAAPNFEAPADANADNVYQLTIKVQDSAGGSSEQNISVTVANVNEAPSVTSPATFSTAENTTAVATLTATDPDLPAQALTWSISGGADAAKFTINATTGALAFVNAPNFEAPTDAGANNVYNLLVQVTDPGGLNNQQAVAVTVTNANEAPAVTSASAFSTAENTTAVATLTATDPDLPAQALTWSISGGADAARFAINGATGALSFVAAPSFAAPTDAGADNVYNLIVRVTDAGGLGVTQGLAVTVTSVNTPPVITAPASFTLAENTTAVATLTATDTDLPAQALTWAIAGGADAPAFVIDAATGALTLAAAPDFEAPADANADNVYAVTVRVTDPGGLSSQQSLTVQVADVNEPPTLQAPASANTDEDVALVLSGALGNGIVFGDPDASQGALTVTLRALSGTVTVANTSGLTFTQGTGRDDASAEFTGTLVDLQAALASVTFTPATDFNGPADLYVGIRDAADASLADARHVAITVRAVADAPRLDASGPLTVAAGTEQTLTDALLHATDVDTPASSLTYTITRAGSAGTLARDGAALATGASFTQAEVTAGRIAYVAASGPSATDAIGLSLSDGSGSAPIAFNLVASVTAPPVAAAPVTTPAPAATAIVVAPAAAKPTASADLQAGATGTSTASVTSDNTASQASAAKTQTTGTSAAAPAGADSFVAAGVQSAKAPNHGATVTPPAAGSGGNTGDNAAPAIAAAVPLSADRRMGSEHSGGPAVISLTDLSTRIDQALPSRRDLPMTATIERQMQLIADYLPPSGATAHGRHLDDGVAHLREDLEQRVVLDKAIVASSAAVSAGLSIGYVVWLLRGGVLLSSLLASVPAWSSIDPLPVLSNATRRSGNKGEDDSLQGMLKKAARPKVRPEKPAPGSAEPALPAAAPPSGRRFHQ